MLRRRTVNAVLVAGDEPATTTGLWLAAFQVLGLQEFGRADDTRLSHGFELLAGTALAPGERHQGMIVRATKVLDPTSASTQHGLDGRFYARLQIWMQSLAQQERSGHRVQVHV